MMKTMATLSETFYSFKVNFCSFPSKSQSLANAPLKTESDGKEIVFKSCRLCK